MANRRRAKITALGRYVPPRVITNHDLSKMVETNHDWIVERTGIHERHWVEKGTPTSELAVKAVDDLLKRRGIEAGAIELIIVATVTPDMFFPSTACLIQDKIRATRAWGFDVSAACSSFLYALTTGAQFIESGQHKRVLVVGADVMTSILNPEDRTTLILSGGGSLHPSSRETVDRKMHYVHQNGQAVFKYAVRKMEELSRSMLERNNLTGADIGAFIAHQANLRIIDATANKIGLDQSKVIKNIHKYGNTTSATIPLAIGDAIDDGKLKKGDLVLFAAVGAGFTSGCVLARWAY